MERRRREERRVYAPDEVPDGLVTLIQAEHITGAHRRRLNSWVQRCTLRARGRVRAPARGGGYILVSLAEVERVLRDPPRPGPRERD